MERESPIVDSDVALATELLAMLNGDWSIGTVTHYCWYPWCCKGGQKELATLRIVILLSAVLLDRLGERVPSTHRWSTVSPALSVQGFGLLCHNILGLPCPPGCVGSSKFPTSLSHASWHCRQRGCADEECHGERLRLQVARLQPTAGETSHTHPGVGGSCMSDSRFPWFAQGSERGAWQLQVGWQTLSAAQKTARHDTLTTQHNLLLSIVLRRFVLCEGNPRGKISASVFVRD